MLQLWWSHFTCRWLARLSQWRGLRVCEGCARGTVPDNGCQLDGCPWDYNGDD